MTTTVTIGDLILRQLSTGYTGPPPARPWKPPLRHPTALNKLLEHQQGHLSIPVGVMDLPFRMTQEPWIIELFSTTPSLAIGGAPQTGKSTALQTLITSMACTHSPKDAQVMALDFSAGKLTQLTSLPHVLAVATPTDIPRVTRILGEIAAIRQYRRDIINTRQLGSWERYRQLRQQGQINDPYGDILFVLDGWDDFIRGPATGQPGSWVPATMKNGHERFVAAVEEIMSGGANQGIHTIIACTRWGSLRGKYRDYLPLRIDLAPADLTETGLDPRVHSRNQVRTIPENLPGRALASNATDWDGLAVVHQHVMVAAPRLDDVDSMDGIDYEATIAAINGRWHGVDGPPKLSLLPDKVHLDKLLALRSIAPADTHALRWTIPVGLTESFIGPQYINLTETPNILVFGERGSGKTTAARSIAHAITTQNNPEQVRFVVVSFDGKLHGVVPDAYLLRPDTFIRNPARMDAIFNDQIIPGSEDIIDGQPIPGTAKKQPGLITSLQSRRIPENMTPSQTTQRDWWPAPYEIIVLIDDWHLVQPALNPLLNDLFGLAQYVQMPDTGVHLIATCSSAKMQTATMTRGGMVVAAWDMGCPTFVLSSSPSDSATREFTVMKRPPGQATFVVGKAQEDVVQMAYKEGNHG